MLVGRVVEEVVLGSPLSVFDPPYSSVLAIVLRDGRIVYARRFYEGYAGEDVDESLIVGGYIVLYEDWFDIDTRLESRIREVLGVFSEYVSIDGLIYTVYPVAVRKISVMETMLERMGVYMPGKRIGHERTITAISLMIDVEAVSAAGLSIDEARSVIENYLRSLGKPWKTHFIDNVIEYRMLYKILR